MRIKIDPAGLDLIFTTAKLRGLATKQIAEELHVSSRSITDWKKGKYSVEKTKFEKLIKITGLKKSELEFIEIEDFWQNSYAGKKGSQVRQRRHGDLATAEGRKKGGQNSYKKRAYVKNDIFERKKILYPKASEDLAEFAGIMIGDGTITKYQVSVALNSETDIEYSKHVSSLFKKLFGVETKILKRKNSNCITVTASSVELVNFLIYTGLLKGHKIRQGLDIPSWVQNDHLFSRACLRGIFDTDGGVYQEIHKYKDRKYCYTRLSLVSASENLRNSIFRIFCELEINSKIRNNRSVNIERLTDIQTYFRVIGSSNPKHLSRWKQFGGVG